ncbi:MAG: hypothetical protein HY319_22175 [Armatimonadetes bacterium]|nr:hypothetical protein [Armatimonadota bacterium]
MPKPVICLVLLALLGSACAGNVTSFERPDPKGVYRNEEQVFCLKVPEDWDIRERFEGATVVFLSPLGGKQDDFRENLIVRVEELSEEISAQEYRRRKLEGLASELKGFQDVDEGEEGTRAWAVYRHQLADPELQVLAYFDVNASGGVKRGYVLAFSSPVDEFPKWEQKFRSIAGDLLFDLSRCPMVTPSPGSAEVPVWLSDTPTPGASPSPGETPAATPGAGGASPGETAPEVEATPGAGAPSPERTP